MGRDAACACEECNKKQEEIWTLRQRGSEDAVRIKNLQVMCEQKDATIGALQRKLEGYAKISVEDTEERSRLTILVEHYRGLSEDAIVKGYELL